MKTNSILIELTNRCNLNCLYCFEKKRDLYRDIGQNFHQSREQTLKVLSENQEITNVTLSGGEPLLYENLEKIIEWFSEKQITLLTNGIKRIENKEVIRDLDIVVSLDGDYDVMSRHRGISESQFLRINKTIEWYIKYAKSVSVNTVVTPYNINKKEYYPYEKFRDSCFYCFAVPSAVFTPTDLCLKTEQYGDVTKQIQRYLEKYNFHMPCTMNVIRSCYAKESIQEIAKEIIIPEYHLPTDCFYIFDRRYKTFEEVEEDQQNIYAKIEYILKNYLNSEKNLPFIEPYSCVEAILYKEEH